MRLKKKVTTMLESDFWSKYVRPNIKGWGAYDRIENSLASGVADVSYAFKPVQGWIELKVAKGYLIYFRKLQIPWLLRRVPFAHHMWLLVLQGDWIWLIHASQLVSAPTRRSGRYTVVDLRDLKPETTGKRVRDKDFWKRVQALITEAR